MGDRGYILPQSLLLGLILVVFVLAIASAISQALAKSSEYKDTVVAEGFASELLEFFRSQPDDVLKAYLENNPSLPGAPPYRLCAHINILNRSNGSVINPDPLAGLPSSVLDQNDAPMDANRFYQILVVNMATLEVRSDLCNRTAREIYFADRTAQAAETIRLAPEEKFLVTVGVTWIPKRTVRPKRVVMSTILPDRH